LAIILNKKTLNPNIFAMEITGGWY